MYDIVNMNTGEILGSVSSFANYARFADDFYNKYGLVFHIVSFAEKLDSNNIRGWVEVELLDWDGVHYNIVTDYN